MRFIFSMLICLLSITPSFAADFLQQKAQGMYQRGADIQVVKSSQTGVGVIALGHAFNGDSHKALELARMDALKHLGAYLRGERVTSTDQATFVSNGDECAEAFFSQMTTHVDAFLKSAEQVASGRSQKETWVAVAVTQRGNAVHGELDKISSSNEVKAKGFGSLQSGQVKARQIALGQALRNAVEQYLGVSTVSRSTAEDGGNLRSGVSAVSRGHVEKYSVIKEYVANGQYVVEIAARVSEKENGTSLSAVKESLGRPSFFIYTKDQRLREMLMEVLSDNELPVTAQESSARYVLLAKVKKQKYTLPADEKMKGMKTTITIAACDSKNASDALFTVKNDPERSIEVSADDELLERNSYKYALEDVQKKFVGQINKTLNQQFNNGAKVIVRLIRFDRMRDVDELRSCMEDMPLMKSVSVRPVRNRIAEYVLIYAGDPTSLQLEILKKSRNYRLRGLRAKNTRDGALAFTF
ncbi:hypothetical protein [Desulfobaculum bizertense]|uniref:LPP20 lipoprotein n=1 Tax=Desulfobaculum bizertense DSM 18034 TaxID=1121442 RepID=A0A1T4VRJ2_9BACT|nr:hypothetical protein [Desulfobaculum bizertense]SKA67580.1 hypothetical protein SAMN02745702_00853 [Desulfobaculum bizertense DSM 18034]